MVVKEGVLLYMKKILFMMLLFSSLFVSGCTIGNYQGAKDLGLNSVTGNDDLKSLLKSTQSNKFYSWFGDARVDEAMDGGVPEAVGEEAPTYQSDDYTKTNVQVEGVDEGDIIKTDGSRIYSVSWDRLQVISLLGNGEMELLLNEQIVPVNGETYNSYTYYSELYVTGRYLVVTGQKIEYSIVKLTLDDDTNDDIILDYYPYYHSYTQTSVVFIYDINTLQKVDSFQVSGNLYGSRMIDDKLYFIANYYPPYYALTDEEFDMRPWYIHNEEIDYFDYEDIKYLPGSLYQAFTTITVFNLDEEITIANDIFLSSSYWGQMYVSPTAIYFAANYYTQNFLGYYEQKGLLLSFQISERTGEVSFGGSGFYSGYVINQFAMDEYNGYMRIATTEGWSSSVKNRLYVFERKLVDGAYQLDVVGFIDEGLGKPGERIQSVRFNKDMATIVTFLRTDPLYTIDLSDPTKPAIAGELEVTGFSTYQHPWTDTLILGIGFEANTSGVTLGMKLSLYDITDQENPVEVGNSLVLNNEMNSWTYSEATWNHKAIMIDKSRDCFGFSLWRSNWNNGFYSQINDYVIFDVDPTSANPITLKHSFSHVDYFQQNLNLYENYYWRYDFSIQRAFRVDDYLYIISGEVITSHNLLGDLSVVDDIIFQEAVVNHSDAKPE